MLETGRLRLRELQGEDLPAVRSLFMDPVVMRHYPALQTEAYVADWFAAAKNLYEALGYGPWTLELRDGTFAGQCGPLPHLFEGKLEIEVVCLLQRRFWRDGYAEEASLAALDYVFCHQVVPRLVAFIMPENRPSRRLAIRCGLRFERDVEKDGATMALFSRDRP